MTRIASTTPVPPTTHSMAMMPVMRRSGLNFGLAQPQVAVFQPYSINHTNSQFEPKALTPNQVKAFFMPMPVSTNQTAMRSALPSVPSFRQPKYKFKQFSAVEAYEKEQNTVQNRLAAQRARWVMNEIVRQIRPGMTESTAKVMANRVFLAHPEVEAIWHQPVFRFGPNTQVPPNKPITKDHVLQPHDIFVVEIAPVFTVDDKGKKMLESSAGETFLMRGGRPVAASDVGRIDDPQKRIVQASRDIYNATLDYWRKENPTGLEIGEFIKQEAQKRGYMSPMEPNGHLTGYFPHEGWPHGLNTYPYQPNGDSWMLEVHLRDPFGPYGAYHKGLLK